MESYKNLSGNSGIIAYQIDDDSIKVQFHNVSIYLYNYDKPGQFYVEEMKRLAIAGQGLNRFISKYVKKNYAARLR